MVDIVAHVEKGLRLSQDTKQWKFKHRLSATGRCVRARVYHARKVPHSNESDSKSLLAMARGDDIEKLAIELLVASREPYHSFQKKVTVYVPGLGAVPGHVDCLYGDDTVVDVKGINASGWWYVNHGRHWLPPKIPATDKRPASRSRTSNLTGC